MQTYILRSDMHPQDAINDGHDVSICGNCTHRKTVGDNGRTCYVFSPSIAQVYKSYQKGSYAPINSRNINRFKGRLLRLGSYGDPTAIPQKFWKPIMDVSSAHNSYTHQWQIIKEDWSKLTMASVESKQEKAMANLLGYKTYRVGLTGEKPMRDEMLCPASKEAGKALQCADCMRCNGQTKNIFIPVHGPKHVINKFNQTRAL